MPFIAIALVIAAAFGGGTALAAQNALPGDILWGFKVHVNESLEGAMSSSDVAKTNWDIAAIETRLAEAQTLAAHDTLTAQTQAEIAANFKEHADGVATTIKKLEDSGNLKSAADVAARFQAVLAGSATGSPLISSVREMLDEASTLSAAASLSVQKEEDQY